MNTAMVITNTASGRQLVRSDTVAAKAMQKAIKKGRGAEVLGASASLSGEGVGAEDLASQDAQSGGAQNVSDVRARVGEVTQALGDLWAVFDAIGSYKSLFLLSESATAIAFAAHVLGEVEAGMSSTDHGGDNGGDRGEDNGGDMYNLDLGSSSLSLRVGTGEDALDLVSGSHLHFILGVSEGRLVGSPSAHWEEDSLRISFENGDEVVLMNAANAGSILLTIDGELMTLLSPKVPPGTGLLDIAV